MRWHSSRACHFPVHGVDKFSLQKCQHGGSTYAFRHEGRLFVYLQSARQNVRSGSAVITTSYIQEFEMTIQAKTPEIENTLHSVPERNVHRIYAKCQRRIEALFGNILLGKSTILTENWGTIDSPIQQVIRQIIHCKYSDSLKSCFCCQRALNYSCYAPMHARCSR